MFLKLNDRLVNMNSISEIIIVDRAEYDGDEEGWVARAYFREDSGFMDLIKGTTEDKARRFLDKLSRKIGNNKYVVDIPNIDNFSE